MFVGVIFTIILMQQNKKKMQNKKLDITFYGSIERFF
jgi:hypothetical protein